MKAPQPTAARTTKASAPVVAASILLPDSPIRAATWYQIYSRLARPTLDWVGVAGAAHALGLFDGLHWFSPMDGARMIIALTFITALYGIRSAEKFKGVA